MRVKTEPSATAEFTYLRGQLPSKAHIIAIGGGKGGVGKSFISSSIAIFLANMGYKTYAIDLDLGGANLHTSLGADITEKGINEFILDPQMKLEEASHPTAFPKLRIISGASDSLDAVNINDVQRTRLMSSIFHLDADFIVLDLSAGTHYSTIDFFLMAQSKLVVLTPEPSSIENAYRFMKASFYRRIKRFEFQLHLEDTIAEVMANKADFGVRSPSDLIRIVEKMDSVRGGRLQHLMSQCRFDVILNQVRSYKDVDLGPGIQSVCSKYFGTPCSLLGQVEYDNAVWQSLRKRRHLLIEYPHSRLYAQLMGISRRLASLRPKVKAPLDKAN